MLSTSIAALRGVNLESSPGQMVGRTGGLSSPSLFSQAMFQGVAAMLAGATSLLSAHGKVLTASLGSHFAALPWVEVHFDGSIRNRAEGCLGLRMQETIRV